jgi:hypothetical protein
MIVRRQVRIYHDSPLFSFLETSFLVPPNRRERRSSRRAGLIAGLLDGADADHSGGEQSRQCVPAIRLRHIARTVLELSRNYLAPSRRCRLRALR